MASDRVGRSRLMRAIDPDVGRLTLLVLGWAAVVAVAQVVYLLAFFPTVDVVAYFAGRLGQGSVRLELAPVPAAIISGSALVLGAVGAVVARAMFRAGRGGRHGAHQLAVVSLALIGVVSVTLLVAGLIAALHHEEIATPGIWGGLPVFVGWGVFFTQLFVLLGGSRGKHARPE